MLYIAISWEILYYLRRSLIRRRLVDQVLHYDTRRKALVVSLMYSNMSHVNVHCLGSWFLFLKKIRRDTAPGGYESK